MLFRSDYVDLPARVVTKVNELPTQRRDWTSGGAAVSTGGEIDREAAFNMTGNEGADQFDGVYGGDGHWDQIQDTFPVGDDVDDEGAQARPDRQSF